MRAAILILSDKGAAGQREDTSGPAIRDWLDRQRVETVRTEIIPDDLPTIRQRLIDWSDTSLAELILTCGGTGVSPRDVTPEATQSVIDRDLPGFAELMRSKSLEITPMAILSRAMAGIRNNCLIINLPGSPKAAIENLAAVWPAIGHGVAKIMGDPADCAGVHSVRQPHSPCVVSFTGYSGSGKTTLATAVINLLAAKGYRVGAMKHDAHGFSIDHPGKDSWKMTQAGSIVTVITDSQTLALIKKHDKTPCVETLVTDYYAGMDIVVVEGWKETAPNKIEVYRSGCETEPLFRGANAKNFIAVATDCKLETVLPILDVNQPQAVADFIVARYTGDGSLRNIS